MRNAWKFAVICLDMEPGLLAQPQTSSRHPFGKGGYCDRSCTRNI